MFDKRMLILSTIISLVGVLAGCGDKQPVPVALPTTEAVQSDSPQATAAQATAAPLEVKATATPSPTAAPTPVATPETKPTPTKTPAPTTLPSVSKSNKLVMIDPGHQRVGNNAPEQVGPDTRETKAKVSSGTVGVRTKKPEYVLNLEVSVLLKAELARRGINVTMTRETHDVDISNKQRADMANEAGAALVVRIHADGDASASTKGFSVLYPSAAQPAVKPIAAESKQAASLLLAGLQQATGQKGRGLSARDDLSGFNWSKVPVVLVEIGFMTNPEEDELMSEAAYQQKLAFGIADGIEQFVNGK
ncbi:N-acetylmuramoyl-L-alanine amidase family protein [Paenibacillus qinlingensis]|uniref:N-acetylmuramoyl-L-alanine amidase family protein n=1 Tax=Paenibacillus qinlingensis TaxID=1837343 RepID=UPI001563D5DA|nr:N-acetylmuramoyl-L-alanine amidase [Paenibacillus qinlingensis]NQX62919.1 N-acetylmuramoyl-L-alanine amidase [Paenibacillus qinlingensis]